MAHDGIIAWTTNDPEVNLVLVWSFKSGPAEICLWCQMEQVDSEPSLIQADS